MEGAEVDVAYSAGNSEVDALVASTICAYTVLSQATPGEPPRSSPPHPQRTTASVGADTADQCGAIALKRS